MIDKVSKNIKSNIEKYNNEIIDMSPQETIEWGYKTFKNHFAFTTSFGIQSAVLLDMVHKSSIKNKIKIFWIDTGYLPPETYQYAHYLINKLSLNIEVLQSEISPARMESLYGRLWETNKKTDLDKYHKIRKIKPLEDAFKKYKIQCWGSGVRYAQTDIRNNMQLIDKIRNRFSLRPLLKWTDKKIFYYLQENQLPLHPLFEKGYTTVGDWHSSKPESLQDKGRNTRFGGIKQECGLHTES